MDTKNNIRSIRFSDELAELIERQQGENFTQKFENLVYRCAWELPAKERELKQLEERILISRIRFDKNSGVRMMKKQHYITRDERQQLEALLKAKIPVSQIARQLGFCRQTIYNEIKRGQYVHTCPWWDELRYSADKAQQIHTYRQTAKGRPLKIGGDRAYAAYLEKKMLGMQADGSVDRRKRYSPAAALAAARREGYTCTVCVNTLYSYITKRVFYRLTDRDLWNKGQKKEVWETSRAPCGPPGPAQYRNQAGGHRPAGGGWPLGDGPHRGQRGEQAGAADHGGAEDAGAAGLQAAGQAGGVGAEGI